MVTNKSKDETDSDWRKAELGGQPIGELPAGIMAELGGQPIQELAAGIMAEPGGQPIQELAAGSMPELAGQSIQELPAGRLQDPDELLACRTRESSRGSREKNARAMPKRPGADVSEHAKP